MRIRLAIQYAVDGDLRFISHHDTLRLFERALRRADFSVRYSEGFNPRPRMKVCLPRPVGVASDDELLVVELTQESAAADALPRLARQMPAGLTLRSAERLSEGDECAATEARYEVQFEPSMKTVVAERAAAFLGREHVLVERAASNRHPSRSVDLRSYVESVDVLDDKLCWRQRISQAGTARIGEVLEALGLPSRDFLHRVRRARVRYHA